MALSYTLNTIEVGEKQKMGTKILNYVKREKVMSIAFILAIISMFIVRPDKKYIDYIDLRVLSLLFCLMLLVKGFQEIGLFNIMIEKVFGKVKSSRMLCLMLILLCFFTSMLITNDVALITFVPFAIMALRLCKQEKLMIKVVVFQTMAANLGSMLTPIGNPQNLYLFTASNMELGLFFKTMAPIAGLSLVLLVASVMMISNETISLDVDKAQNKLKSKSTVVYVALFALNLLVVFRIFSWIPTLLLTIIGFVAMKKFDLIKKVDYALLLTFVGFFVFVGNIGRIPQISEIIQKLLSGREILMSAVFSQFLSNVPVALLLSGFTDKFEYLLVGTNVGGLGTLIASMASLISYKLYAVTEGSSKSKYMLVFTIWNVIGLVILLGFSMLFYK